jgi:hypothetical protein
MIPLGPIYRALVRTGAVIVFATALMAGNIIVSAEGPTVTGVFPAT